MGESPWGVHVCFEILVVMATESKTPNLHIAKSLNRNYFVLSFTSLLDKLMNLLHITAQ